MDVENKRIIQDVHNNTWNNAIENVARDIGNKALGYKWMHVNSAESLEFYYDKLSYVNIAISPIIALGVLAPPTTTKITTIKITLGVLAVLNGITSSLLKFWNNIEKSQAHRYTATRYSSLVSNIRRQLSLPYEDRQDGKIYIEWIAREYDQLVAVGPPIDRRCIKRYTKLAKEKNIPVPEQQGGILAIEVINKNDKIPFKIQNRTDTILDVGVISSIEVDTVDNKDHIDIKITEEEQYLNSVPVKSQGTYCKEIDHYANAMMDYELNRLNSYKFIYGEED
jgi:hypothetical protein